MTASPLRQGRYGARDQRHSSPCLRAGSPGYQRHRMIPLDFIRHFVPSLRPWRELDWPCRPELAAGPLAAPGVSETSVGSLFAPRPVTRRRATVPVMAGRSGLDQAALMHTVAVFRCARTLRAGSARLHEGLGPASFPVVRLTIIIPRSNS